MNAKNHMTPKEVGEYHAGWANKAEEYSANWEAFVRFGEQYRTDAALRDRLNSGDMSDVLDALGFYLPPDMDTRVVADTSDTMHVVLPTAPSIPLSDEMLTAVAGGKSASSAGTGGCAGSMACSTLPSTASSVGTSIRAWNFGNIDGTGSGSGTRTRGQRGYSGSRSG